MAIQAFPTQAGSVPVVFHPDSFVSERRGFVYHCVPKALSRSMLEYLRSVDPDGYLVGERGAGPEVLRRADRPTGFSFVRNPYSRIVAVYYDKFVNYRETPSQREMFGRYERLRPDMTFSDFVDWLVTEEGSDRRADPHFLSQHYFLVDGDGEPAVDYVGKVESAAEDVAELQRLLGLDVEPLPHVNANATRDRDRFDTSARWLDVLDDGTKRLLAQRYDGDFELLGYPRLPYRTVPLFPRGGGRPAAATAPRRGAGAAVKAVLARLGVEVRRVRRPTGSRPAGGSAR